jgi:tripartite-type tricarboxylate transporter receptor subunit TctC
MKRRQIRRRDVIALGLSALSARALAPRSALAQAKYPERPIRFVVPYPPGGVYDAVGRPWADKMKSVLGSVVVENMGGAGGALGTAAVVRAQPDGYTILLGSPLINLINSIAVSKPLFDPKDLEPISILATSTFGITVHPSVPAQNLQELIAYAKANPGKLSYGTAGVGSPNHLTGEMFKFLANAPGIVQVPYRGMGPALIDAVGGQIPMVVATVTSQVLDLHHTGKLRVLAVTTPARLVAAPDIPTAVESGIAKMIALQVIGLFAPIGTPKPIIDQISEATRTAMADAEYRQRLVTSGFEPPADTSPQKMRQVNEEEFARWTPIIKSIGLMLN